MEIGLAILKEDLFLFVPAARVYCLRIGIAGYGHSRASCLKPGFLGFHRIFLFPSWNALAECSLREPPEYCAEEYDGKEPRQITGTIATPSGQNDTSRRVSIRICRRTFSALACSFAFTKGNCGIPHRGSSLELTSGSALPTVR